MEQVSSHNTSEIKEYHIGQSSGISATNSRALTSSLSSVYYSPRIQSMIENRSTFSSELEFGIESSKVHWSDLTDSDRDNALPRLTNREYFEVLKKHPEWRGFFKDIKVKLGKKINEGAQAEIYDAEVKFEDGHEFGYGYYVVKVMKGENPLQDFQRQWPVGMLSNVSKDEGKGPLMWIKGGTLIKNRFGFVMVRQWGDLRKLIDLKKGGFMKKDEVIKKVGFIRKAGFTFKKALHLKKLNNNQDVPIGNNQGPPFENIEFVNKVILCIAEDMNKLHSHYGIVHRDLKASNVLLWSLGEELPDSNPDVKANVVDYECSQGVVGTKFWRAPEILQQLKDGIPSSELMFTRMTDVYSYSMTCYEILTGRIPFEDYSAQDYDLVLNGNRPELPISGHVPEMIRSCWNHEPLSRPTFSEIVTKLEKMSRWQLFDKEPTETDDHLNDDHNSLAARLPPCWPAPEQAPTLTPGTIAQAQREANALLNDILERRMNRIDFERDNIIKLREICRNSGARVSFETANMRDAFYRTAVELVHDVCLRGGEFPDEGVVKFIAGLAGNIGLDAEKAAIMVIASVAARTRGTFLQVAWGFEGYADELLRGLVQLHENFSPVQNSPEMEMAARGLTCIPVKGRRELLKWYIMKGGRNTEWLAKEALSLVGKEEDDSDDSEEKEEEQDKKEVEEDVAEEERKKMLQRKSGRRRNSGLFRGWSESRFCPLWTWSLWPRQF